MVKCPSTVRETQVQSLVWEDPLEKEMATLSSILAWRISCQTPLSIGSQELDMTVTKPLPNHHTAKGTALSINST